MGFASLPGWRISDPRPGVGALKQTCTKPPAYLRRTCLALARVDELDEGEVRAFLEAHFVPYAVLSEGQADGLFTGYYQPEIHASLTCGGAYHVPLYRKPFELTKNADGSFGHYQQGKWTPYWRRDEIGHRYGQGVLAHRGLEIACLKDPVAAFFLQVQGSGLLVLEDDRVVGVGYAGKNGHAYRSIGRYLIDQGEIAEDEVSLQSIRQWLQEHPWRQDEVLYHNPSYVFFRRIDGEQGPIGSAGVPLTPGYSLAVDSRSVPLGLPVWLEAQAPLAAGQLQRLVVAQDTGSAIKGVVRGDVFWGRGVLAEWVAGHMKSRGRYWVLAPKEISLRALLGSEMQAQK